MVLTSLLVLVICLTFCTVNEQESAFPCQQQWNYFWQGAVRCVPTLMLVKCSISLHWMFNWTKLHHCFIFLYTHNLTLLGSHPLLFSPRNNSLAQQWCSWPIPLFTHSLLHIYIPRGLKLMSFFLSFCERKLMRHWNCMVSVCAGKLMCSIHSNGQLNLGHSSALQLQISYNVILHCS